MKKIIVLLSFFGLIACQEKTTNMTIDNSTQWHFLSGQYQGKVLKPIPNDPITLKIFPEKWVGISGVNHYQIPIQMLNYQEVKVSDNSIITTRMAGSPQAMEMEYHYLQALGKVKKINIENHKLILTGEKVELIFEK